jgi:hypothetical protein
VTEVRSLVQTSPLRRLPDHRMLIRHSPSDRLEALLPIGPPEGLKLV